MQTFITAPWQENYMKKHSSEYTARALAHKLGLTRVDVYNYCARHNLPLILEKSLKAKKGKPPAPRYRPGYWPDVKKSALDRPPSVYTNTTPYGIANHF